MGQGIGNIKKAWILRRYNILVTLKDCKVCVPSLNFANIN